MRAGVLVRSVYDSARAVVVRGVGDGGVLLVLGGGEDAAVSGVEVPENGESAGEVGVEMSSS